MIDRPLNDQPCLDVLHDQARKDSQHPVFVEFAHVFQSTAELAAFLRTRPRRLDFGHARDGPRVACLPSQRLRRLPNDPNCFEGTGMYLTLAEALDPATQRTSMTIRVPAGYHTFPVEHSAPVILDPIAPRNAMRAGLYHRSPENVRLFSQPTTWLLSIARDAACSPCDAARVRNGIGAITAQRPAHLRSIATLLTVAETQARLWGPDGLAAYDLAATAIRDQLETSDLGRVPSTPFPPFED